MVLSQALGVVVVGFRASISGSASRRTSPALATALAVVRSGTAITSAGRRVGAAAAGREGGVDGTEFDVGEDDGGIGDAGLDV